MKFFIALTSLLFSFSVLAETTEKILTLKKVTGRVASFNSDVTRSCSVSGHQQFSEAELVELVKEARKENEGIVFLKVAPTIPSEEYVAKLFNSKAQLVAKVNLLKLHENAYGKKGKASKRLVEIIDSQCA